MNPLISKARKPKFDLYLKIFDLNNVPLVSGTSHVKWHLPSSTSAEHRGRTEKSLIKEHKVSWEYVRTIPVRLTIDKANNLQECLIHFEVVQDYSGGIKGEKITLGFVTLNLAEYVEESESADGEEGVVRRYLMQESKINSTLKIGISMKQIDGERNFVAPPLKTAPVFGGIAGIMGGGEAEQDELGNLPTMSKSRDHSELQDMYRRALAASWACQPGELPADQCIEDIFSGGDGWKDKYDPKSNLPRTRVAVHDDSGDEQHTHTHRRNGSTASSKSQSTIKTQKGHRKQRSRDIGRASGIQSPKGETSSDSARRGRDGGGFRTAQEIDEFDVRDDLVAWALPGKGGVTNSPI